MEPLFIESTKKILQFYYISKDVFVGIIIHMNYELNTYKFIL